MSGAVGTTVVLQGSDFYGASVRFNGTYAPNIANSPTELIVSVPAGATTGPLVVTQFDGSTGTSSSNFTVVQPPSISSFSPTSGVPGSIITISGNNFSSITGNDAVTINGTPANVTAASSTSLSISVPASATTGPIAVTVGGQAGTSSTNFTVVQPMPTITGFSPINGPVGTTVSITGTHFDPIAANDSVTFNGVTAAISSASTGQLVVAVPNGASTGQLGVTVSGQSATSASSFTVTSGVGGNSPSTTLYTYDANSRLRSMTTPSGGSASYTYDALGNILNVSTYTANQVAVFGFSPSFGPAGTSVTINGQGFSATPSANAVTVGGAPATVTSATSSQLIALVPGNATTGPIGVTVGSNAGSSADSFSVTPTSLAQQPTISGFSPTSGQAGTVVTLTGQNFAATLGASYVYMNSVQIAPTTVTDSQITFSVPANVSTSPIAVTTPYGQATTSGPFTVALPAGVSLAGTVPITIGGAAQSLSIPVNASGAFAFVDTTNAGTWVTLQLTSLTTADSAIAYGVYDPTNILIASGQVNGGNMSIHLPRLLKIGTYQLVFAAGSSGPLAITASLQPDPVVVVNGAAIADATSVGGQSKRYVFSGATGQMMSMQLAGLTFQPSNSLGANVYLTMPDGTTGPFDGVYGFCELMPLQGGGSYTQCGMSTPLGLFGDYAITIQAPPSTSNTISYSLTLSSGLTKSPLNATPAIIAANRAGQNLLLPISAVAGQPFFVQVDGIATTPAAVSIPVAIVDPRSTVLTNFNATTGAGVFVLPSQTGTYTVRVESDGIAPLIAAQAFLDAGTSLPVDGSPVAVSTTTPGQSIRLNFNATAGQKLGLGIGSLVLNPAVNDSLGIGLIYPDGTIFRAITGTANVGTCLLQNTVVGGCGVNLSALTQTGTYTLILTPSGGQEGAYATGTYGVGSVGGTFSANVSLTSDQSAALTTGTPLTVNLTQPGQNASFTFAATAGQPQVVEISNTGFVPNASNMIVALIDPNGTAVGGAKNANGGIAFYLVPAVTGTYTVLVNADPNGYVQATGAPASPQVFLDPGVTATIDGPPVNVASATLGQTARLNFSATAGQNIGIGLTGLSITPANNSNDHVLLELFNPDGTFNSSLGGSGASCTTDITASGGCGWSLSNLPQTGTYTVLLTPDGASGSYGPTAPSANYASGFAASVQLSTQLTGTITAGSTTQINLSAGQSESLSVALTAGQPAVIEMTTIATTPANQPFGATLLDPSGDEVSSVTSPGGMVFYVDPPTSGTYSLNVNTQETTYALASGATGSAQIALDAGTALSINGAGVNVNTTATGQATRLNFAGTSGQNITLNIANLALAPAGNAWATFTLYNPDGTVNTTSTGGYYAEQCQTAQCSFALNNLPQTGPYTLIAVPGTSASGATTAQTLSATISLTSP